MISSNIINWNDCPHVAYILGRWDNRPTQWVKYVQYSVVRKDMGIKKQKGISGRLGGGCINLMGSFHNCWGQSPLWCHTRSSWIMGLVWPSWRPVSSYYIQSVLYVSLKVSVSCNCSVEVLRVISFRGILNLQKRVLGQ